MSEYSVPLRFTPQMADALLPFRSVPVTVCGMKPKKDWAALAREIKRRRVVLGYQRQNAFAEQLPFGARLLGELENGRRDNYEDATLDALEVALHWGPGSVEAVLSGGQANELPLPVPKTNPLTEMQNAELVAFVMAGVTELARRLPNVPVRREAGEGMVTAQWDATMYGGGGDGGEQSNPARRA
jgi:hypothetical protein